MARFLLLCILLAELSVFIASRDLDPIARYDTKRLILTDSIVPSPSPSKNGENKGSEESPRIGGIKRHHSVDKSVAGGDVILGGFAIAFIVAIVCYIRVTRSREDKN